MVTLRGYFRRPKVKRFGLTVPKPGRAVRVAVVEKREPKRLTEKKRKLRPKRKTRKRR